MKKFYLLLIPLFALALLVGCAPEDGAPTPPAPVKKNQPIAFDGTLLTGKHTVILKTSKGNVTIELDGDAAPKTVTNFVVLSKAGYYNGLTFHRVIPDFMIQGGDPNGNGTGGESVFGPKFEDEIKGNNLPMDRGMIAMANAGPNTNGSQFFIITKEGGTPWLIGHHTVFGKVTKGMDVVDAISKVQTGANDMPEDPVTFEVEVVN
ncbi:MAG: peptidylprolyl isomerase [Candidatus Peribacteraceae bacterium]|nr:peptidylprolyl isomerase [Candidatus Peribacteraceae bacterium]MDD5074364.1 peptidylprolyl isomerase [Candidatus Peribacteraceae bacterium]